MHDIRDSRFRPGKALRRQQLHCNLSALWMEGLANHMQYLIDYRTLTWSPISSSHGSKSLELYWGSHGRLRVPAGACTICQIALHVWCQDSRSEQICVIGGILLLEPSIWKPRSCLQSWRASAWKQAQVLHANLCSLQARNMAVSGLSLLCWLFTISCWGWQYDCNEVGCHHTVVNTVHVKIYTEKPCPRFW